MDQELLKIKSALEKIDNISAYAEILIKEEHHCEEQWLEINTNYFKTTVAFIDYGFELFVRYADDSFDEYRYPSIKAAIDKLSLLIQEYCIKKNTIDLSTFKKLIINSLNEYSIKPDQLHFKNHNDYITVLVRINGYDFFITYIGDIFIVYFDLYRGDLRHYQEYLPKYKYSDIEELKDHIYFTSGVYYEEFENEK
jgi:hypothetical protein